MKKEIDKVKMVARAKEWEKHMKLLSEDRKKVIFSNMDLFLLEIKNFFKDLIPQETEEIEKDKKDG